MALYTTLHDLNMLVTSFVTFYVSNLLFQVQEWLYTDGENAPAGEFMDRLGLLKSIGGSIFFRCCD